MTSLNEYQCKALSTAKYPNVGSNLVYPVLGLAGEAGEVANLLKKYIRKPTDDVNEIALRKMKLADELGDVLWYLAVGAHEIGYSLAEIADMNLHKLQERSRLGTLTSTEIRTEERDE